MTDETLKSLRWLWYESGLKAILKIGVLVMTKQDMDDSIKTAIKNLPWSWSLSAKPGSRVLFIAGMRAAAEHVEKLCYKEIFSVHEVRDAIMKLADELEET
jgi:hypothetical protein